MGALQDLAPFHPDLALTGMQTIQSIKHDKQTMSTEEYTQKMKQLDNVAPLLNDIHNTAGGDPNAEMKLYTSMYPTISRMDPNAPNPKTASIDQITGYKAAVVGTVHGNMIIKNQGIRAEAEEKKAGEEAGTKTPLEHAQDLVEKRKQELNDLKQDKDSTPAEIKAKKQQIQDAEDEKDATVSGHGITGQIAHAVMSPIKGLVNGALDSFSTAAPQPSGKTAATITPQQAQAELARRMQLKQQQNSQPGAQ
jgi:hypothetical protein